MNLAQLIGQLKDEIALGFGQQLGQAHEFLGKRLDARAIGRQLAERSDTQHIRHENKLPAIPRVKQGTGNRQALGFANLNLLVGPNVDPVLHYGVRPGDADDIELGNVAGEDPDGLLVTTTLS